MAQLMYKPPTFSLEATPTLNSTEPWARAETRKKPGKLHTYGPIFFPQQLDAVCLQKPKSTVL